MTETLSDTIGNPNAAANTVDLHKSDSVIRYLAVRWDGDKIRGMKWTYLNGEEASVGGADDVDYTLTSYNFAPREYLKEMLLHDSGYGYGSFRQIVIASIIPGTPPQPESFTAGPGG